MIYLATAYSHSDPAVRAERYEMACAITVSLLKQGKFVFSPIVHNHMLAVSESFETGFDFWEQYDLHMLQKADMLLVVKMDGWTTSKGIKREIDFAVMMEIPVCYYNPKTGLIGRNV